MDLQNLLQQVAANFGYNTGKLVNEKIQEVLGLEHIDVKSIQDTVKQIQDLLDADPSTPEFDVGQNIVTQLKSQLGSIQALQAELVTLKGDDKTAGSIAKKIADTKTAVETELRTAQTDIQNQINAIKGNSETSISAVQTDVNTAKAGAGLAEDGSYVPNTESNYISGATNLADADSKLDAALKEISDRITNTQSSSNATNADTQAELDRLEAAIGTNEDGTFAPSTTNTFTSEATTVKGSIDALDAALKVQGDKQANDLTATNQALATVNSSVEKTNASIGLDANGNYVPDTEGNYTSNATSVADAIKKVDVASKANELKGAENTASINTLTQTVADNKTAVESSVAAERAYADSSFLRLDTVAGLDLSSIANAFSCGLDKGYNNGDLSECNASQAQTSDNSSSNNGDGEVVS